MVRRVILPAGSPQPVSYYSHGIRVGPVLYSAGQTARDSSGSLVGIGDARRQARQVFYNLSLVLQEAGLRVEDVVRMNIFTRSAADLPDILGVARHFLAGHAPALTTASVDSLAYPEYLLEVEVIAEIEEE